MMIMLFQYSSSQCIMDVCVCEQKNLIEAGESWTDDEEAVGVPIADMSASDRGEKEAS